MTNYEIARRRVRDFRLRFPNYMGSAAAMEDMVMAAMREAAGEVALPVSSVTAPCQSKVETLEAEWNGQNIGPQPYRPGLVGPRPPDPTYDESGGQSGWAERFIVDGEGGYRRMDIAEMMVTQEGMGQS